jgi:proteasome lid subunit RPN8/RPN11
MPRYDRFGLIGSWHSHPSGKTEPSQRDLQTLKETVAHPTARLGFKVLLIVCRDSTEHLRTEGVVLQREPMVLSKIDVSIETVPEQGT